MLTIGQSSIGTLKVAPSGGKWAVGEEGDPAWPCIRRNCLATLPFHVFDFGDGNGSTVWLGFRVLLTGDWPVGERLRKDVSFLMPLWLGNGLNRWPDDWGWFTPLGVVGPGVCGTACCFDVLEFASWKIGRILHVFLSVSNIFVKF